jgi:UPF0716 family protein affecting phage T7 exclusion
MDSVQGLAVLVGRELGYTWTLLFVVLIPASVAWLIYVLANTTYLRRRRFLYRRPYDRYSIVLKR